MDARLVQFENAESPIVVMPASNVMFVNSQQSENACAPTSRTVAGTTTLRSLVHIIKAASLIFRTGHPPMLGGMTTSPSYEVFASAGRV